MYISKSKKNEFWMICIKKFYTFEEDHLFTLI
jgi:hypothetical protein